MALTRRGDGSKVRAGDMTHQVEIWQNVYTEDGQGGRTSAPAKTTTVWANLMPLSASRALAYGVALTNHPYEVDMRYEGDAYTLTEDDYLVVVETSQKLHVHSVINADMRYERAKLLCTEKK